MNFAKTPPATHKLFLSGSRKLLLKPSLFSLRLEIALDLVFNCLNHAWDGYNYRDFLLLYGLNDLRGIKRLLKENRAANELRDKYAEELSKDVAQGKQIQKANGMKDALVLNLLRDLRLKRREVRQYVAV